MKASTYVAISTTANGCSIWYWNNWGQEEVYHILSILSNSSRSSNTLKVMLF